MDISLGFITKLVDEDKFSEAYRSGITADFLAEDYATIWSYIQRHRADYGSVPSRDAVLKAFPGFEFGRYKEPLQYFIDALKEQWRENVLDEGVLRAAEVYQRDTKEAETVLRDTLSKLHISAASHQDVSLAASARDRVTAYQARKENPGADGCLSGWDSLDYQTLGWHGEEFIVVVGEKYTGKSWVMLWLKHNALMQNERCLFVTKEMSQEAITRRYDSIYASVPFDSLRRGELTEIEENRYKEAMERFAESSAHTVIARQGVATIEDVEAKAIETDASIVFIDSVYLFPPDSRSAYSGETSKRLAISQKCKEMASRLGIPVIASVQAGRKKTKDQKPDIDNIEWSNAFSQDAETVIYIHKDELDRELGRLQVHLLKSRDGDIAEFFVNTDFEHMRFDERVGETAEPTTEVFDEDDELAWS